jgi:hypothetical protein
MLESDCRADDCTHEDFAVFCGSDELSLHVVCWKHGVCLISLTWSRASVLWAGQFSIASISYYRSQGQTISCMLVDIALPPTSLFNLCGSLSRSSGRETIHLLRHFDDSLFMQGYDPILLAEDERLEQLNERTQRWGREMRSRGVSVNPDGQVVQVVYYRTERGKLLNVESEQHIRSSRVSGLQFWGCIDVDRQGNSRYSNWVATDKVFRY